jgi:hypothetical protein
MQMNRREFLKSIAALGAAFTVPFEALAVASDAAIDDLWQEALGSPTTFYVNDWRMLSADAEPYSPSTRGEMLMIEPVASRLELIALARDEGDVSDAIEEVMADEKADPGADWEDWVAHADDDTLEYLIDKANQWVNGELDSDDWERANISGYSSTGSALRFFRDDFEYNELFDIAIVEGDCPGSSYFAAELRMDIAEANVLALEQGIPIRFASMEV